MADFDEKLNQILSNPDAMAQIARLAQSLNGPPPAQSSNDPPPVTDSRNAPPQSRNVSPPVTQSRAAAPQSLNGPPPVTQSRAASPVTDSGAADFPPPDASGAAFSASNVPPAAPDAPPVPPIPPAVDTVARFLPLLQELGGDSDARRLLYALRPYLRPQKQEKVERALHLARLFRVGKKFLSQWEG